MIMFHSLFSDPIDKKIHEFETELMKLLKMKHPSIPKLYGYCLNPE